MSEETEGTVAPEAVEETATEAAQVEEPQAETAVAVEDAPVADEPQAVAEAVEETPAPAGRREALVYLCERGHRTLVLFGEPPTTCSAQLTRSTRCGRQIYHMTELPEQVQKALNPIKASKKKAGKK